MIGSTNSSYALERTVGSRFVNDFPSAFLMVGKGTEVSMPSRGEMVYVESKRADPPPEVIAYLAFGPMTAMDLVEGLRGRTPLSFLRRTVASAEARRRRARTSGVSRPSSGPSKGMPEA